MRLGYKTKAEKTEARSEAPGRVTVSCTDGRDRTFYKPGSLFQAVQIATAIEGEVTNPNLVFSIAWPNPRVVVHWASDSQILPAEQAERVARHIENGVRGQELFEIITSLVVESDP